LLSRRQIAQRGRREKEREERAARDARRRLCDDDDDRPMRDVSREPVAVRDNAVASPVRQVYPIVPAPPRQTNGSPQVLPRWPLRAFTSETTHSRRQAAQRLRRQKEREERAAQQRLSDDRPMHDVSREPVDNAVASPVPTPTLRHADPVVHAPPRQTNDSPQVRSLLSSTSETFLSRRQVAQRLRRQKERQERAARDEQQRLSDDRSTHVSHESVTVNDNAVASPVPTPTLRSAVPSSTAEHGS
jgi:hypothetical protein